MEQALPKGIPTIRNSAGNYTRPDNVFVSSDITEWIMECRTQQKDKPPTADHFPIVTNLEFLTTDSHNELTRNWRATDWGKFRTELTAQLRNIPAPRELQSPAELITALNDVEEAIQKTADKCVPRKTPTPYAKRWWTKELDQARKAARRLARQAE
ncbi:hypothetical protein BJ912DRAFT_848774 [Pholiota molesta]|nr:hypothetical protein BJ912DRAFT_848774 [Pholiota molesta]